MIENKKNIVDNDSLLYRPFPVEKGSKITIKRDHYSTSLDPRGYIPVYEYTINGTPIMWDRETGYVHFTGIWKALGNSKSDIVKMVDSNPELGTKKIRGGFLRIQGTWIPYDYAHLLCKRTAWNIRYELIPIFGQKFPSEVLSPDHKDYGCLILNKRNTKNQMQSTVARKPYTKQKKTTKRNPKPMKSCNKVEQMSVTNLLNISPSSSSEEDDTDELMTLSDESLSLSSIEDLQPTQKPSSFRVIQTYPPENYQLPPINSSNNYTSQLPSIWESTTSVSQDIIDTISATILLQRLSQDDGARPFKPFESSHIPSKVIVGHQEFTICWD